MRTRIWPSYDGSVRDSVYPTIPIQEEFIRRRVLGVCWRSTRTCLEYTFARDTFSLSAEAYSAESGAIDEFENSIWGIFCLASTKLGRYDGWCGEDVAVSASDGRPRVGAQVHG